MELEDVKELVHHKLVRFINSDLENPYTQTQLCYEVGNCLRVLANNGWYVVDDRYKNLQFVGLTFDNGVCYNQFKQIF